MMDQLLEETHEKYSKERYLNRTEILLRKRKSDFTVDFKELWDNVLELRKLQGRKISLKDQKGNYFWFSAPPFVLKKIHFIEVLAKNKLEELVTIETFRQFQYEEMIIEESFYSSVIEGAFSTKKRTKELIKSKDPKDKSEQMILNNYDAMLFIIENIDKDLTEDLFIYIHKMITKDTLEADEITEKYRNDAVFVTDPNKSDPIYAAPNAELVQGLMNDLFEFINDDSDSNFIPPITKAFIIHFYIGYVHPFFDGNGRTARAFTYMYLLKKGYDFFRFFSISSMINQQRGKYYKAFKDTEDFGSDLTYFIAANAEITFDSIDSVIDKLTIATQSQLLKEALVEDEIFLSKRQEKFLRFMEKKDNNLATIAEYQKKMDISYETARTDLMELEQLGLFKKVKKGKKFIFKFIGAKGYFENR